MLKLRVCLIICFSFIFYHDDNKGPINHGETHIRNKNAIPRTNIFTVTSSRKALIINKITPIIQKPMARGGIVSGIAKYIVVYIIFKNEIIFNQYTKIVKWRTIKDPFIF
jgi:hypothetical protein